MKTKISRVLLIAVVALSTLFATSASAQNGRRTPEEKAKVWTDSMKTSLGLDQGQYDKIYQINLGFVNKMKELRSQAGSRDDRKGSLRDLNQSRMKDIGSVLTSDQQQKFKTLHKEKAMRMREHKMDQKQSS